MKNLSIRLRTGGQKMLAVVLAVLLISMTLYLPAAAANGDVMGNPAFRVIAYDTSARIEMPYISGATSYKVYLSTQSNLSDFSGAACVLSSAAYQPTAYTLSGDTDALDSAKTITITPGTTYYFYFVTHSGSTDTVQSKAEADTWTSAKYWTDSGNYDLSWYTGHSSPYSISTPTQLAGLAHLVTNGIHDFSGETVNLMASLDLSAYLWRPIGWGTLCPFMGDFNGNNNVIKGLHTNSSAPDPHNVAVGLFASSRSLIENLGVTDGYLKGYLYVGGIVGNNDSQSGQSGEVINCFNANTISGMTGASGGGPASANIGGIAGCNYGTVRNCYNTGLITGDSQNCGGVTGLNLSVIDGCYNTGTVRELSGADNRLYCIGGVVGHSESPSTLSQITNCYNTGAVSGQNDMIGGIVGGVYAGSVSDCYNTGSVTGSSSSDMVGGISGEVRNCGTGLTIENCFSTGAVSGGSDIGGAVGKSSATCTVQNSYSAGSVTCTGTGSTTTGGFAGANDGTITNCYYDSQIESTYTNTISGVTASTTATMKALSLGTGWTQSPTRYATGGVFSAGSPVNKGYPVLKAFGYTGDDTDVDSEIPHDAGGTNYTIHNAYQLDLIRNFNSSPSKIFTFGGNVDISPAQYGGVDWKQLNNSSSSPFSGTIDGAGYRVSGLSIKNTAPYSYNHSLIGCISGTVKNLGTTSGTVIASDSTAHIAAIVGQSIGGTISNCYNTAIVTGGQYVGGVVGDNSDASTVSGCFNAGPVSGNFGELGGVTGLGDVTNCYNLGSISGVADDEGGVIGQGSATYCYNTGNVTNTGTNSQEIGGVAGLGVADHCYNAGAVIATGANSQEIGGVVGYEGGGSVTDSYNTGAVAGINSVGGVIGQAEYMTVSDNYNTGTVIGTANVGGIAGSVTDGTISSNYYYGCSVGVGGTGASQTGTAPFASLINSSLGAGMQTSVRQQTGLNTDSGWQTALGSGFNIAYSAYAASPMGYTSISGANITATKAGATVQITGSLTITQNSLSASGFDGPTGQTTFPISLPLTIGQVNPAVNLSPMSGLTIGTPATLTATITSAYNPTGTVDFYNNGVLIGSTNTITLISGGSNGTATLSYTPTTLTGLSITADYSGDTNNASAATGSPQTATVSKKSPMLSTPVASPVSPQTCPVSSVSISTTLSGYYGSLTGQTVTFLNGGTVLGTATTDASGVATFTLNNPGANTYHFSAQFAGDTSNNSTVSNSIDYTVNLATQAALSAGVVPSTVTYGDSDFTLSPSGGSGTGAFSYVSSNPSVLSVDPATGLVTVKAAGNAIITVTKAGDATYNAAVKDISFAVAKKTLSVSVSTFSVVCGQSIPTPAVVVTGFAAGESAATVTGFAAPTASLSSGSTGVPATNVPLAVTFTGGNPTNNYSFSYQNSTTLNVLPGVSGNVSVLPAVISDDAPSISLQSSSADVGRSALTSADQAQVAAGSDISIYLKVKKIDAAQADQHVVSSALGGRTLGQYLEVSLIKNINGTESNITQTSSPLRITFAIPDDLLASGRMFSIIRVHDGVAATLFDLDSNPNTITVETDRFSTYAIVYTAATNTNPVENPKTGGATSMIPLATVGFASLTSAMIIKKRRYKVIKKK